VFGWRCPWSGDENDPIPRSYRPWWWLYVWTRRVRHRFGLHDWQVSYPEHRYGVFRHVRCTWCGLVFGRVDRPYPFWVRHPWLWHAMFDGTRLCACQRSKEMRINASYWLPRPGRRR
jgi:hypothetical protein